MRLCKFSDNVCSERPFPRVGTVLGDVAYSQLSSYFNAKKKVLISFLTSLQSCSLGFKIDSACLMYELCTPTFCASRWQRCSHTWVVSGLVCVCLCIKQGMFSLTQARHYSQTILRTVVLQWSCNLLVMFWFGLEMFRILSAVRRSAGFVCVRVLIAKVIKLFPGKATFFSLFEVY